MANLLIEFDNVGLRYPGNVKETLVSVGFKISKGDFYFLTGKSGAGKSSLLKLMDLSLRPTRGEISIWDKKKQLLRSTYGLRGSNIAILRRQIGVVFQNYKLISNLTVEENIALPLRIIRHTAQYIEDTLEDVLSYFHLQHVRKENPLRLSGGQQQLVALARSIITDPDILLADEATASIDEGMSEKIMNLIMALNNRGTAVVFATHNTALIKKYRQPVLNLKHGELTRYDYKSWDKSSIY